ncbi:hypothetical protein FNU79_17840 [Deinococcus detaillensis]|uniref:Membrane-anchored protein n=1 Tax=Deinococcus detaillensis TaxID=2592048 RepID=A0A553UH20_9DEIO|nr:hypothetical protein [Deinococcus detaillensis]TSA79508.1 hypothetical protein FNU79_17840 [Deinococcus detaillensis]
MTAAVPAQNSALRILISKVPEITLFFWIIKILCTTVGETAADWINTNLNFGLVGTSALMISLTVIALVMQFRARRYIPWVYWLCVVLISVVGTLITDNMVNTFNITLVTSTIIFSVLLALTFIGWYRSEKTLSIHSIFTAKREAFYWLTVLFTFALGTAAGDLISENLNVGYLNSALLFAGLIGTVTLAHFAVKFDAIATFWIAYILTRPLGASIGDYMSQAKDVGGLELGTVTTSVIFLVAILAVVIYLSLTRKDQIRLSETEIT